MSHIRNAAYSFESVAAVGAGLWTLLERLSAEAIAARGFFVVALSGGSLPATLGDSLPAETTIDFSKWRVLYADERCVALDHADSNHGAAKKALLDKLPVEPAVVATINPALIRNPQAAASYYQARLTALAPAADGISSPRIDALLLGMGPDGHTCSLFPGHALLDVKERSVVHITDSPKPPSTRITFTFPVLNAARNAIFVCTGDNKADMIHRIIDLEEDVPSARVKPTLGKLYWFLDAPAASKLTLPTLTFKL
ncbi:6-phosphogluconolactonase sol3 [Polyrhizophydium stewartii]|uniref:6-phosphogluconolactonase n=1 Tax=Polyrhizophydium stewartii TaxID=2732419 RepID=A0ABR4NCT5_9FUNG|nr:6-phosphogluconolactonase [Polyrhizophydium stewartii]